MRKIYAIRLSPQWVEFRCCLIPPKRFRGTKIVTLPDNKRILLSWTRWRGGKYIDTTDFLSFQVKSNLYLTLNQSLEIPESTLQLFRSQDV